MGNKERERRKWKKGEERETGTRSNGRMQDVSLSGGQKKTRYKLLVALGKGISKPDSQVIPADHWNKMGCAR